MRQRARGTPIHNQVRSWCSRISLNGDLEFRRIHFFRGCLYYEIEICNLHPNSILLVATFIHLCEAYGGFQPHFDFFRHLFCLQKKGSGGSKIAGGVYLNLHDGMKAQYLHCPWNKSLDDWYKKWFYIHE